MADLLPSALIPWADWLVSRLDVYVLSAAGFKNFAQPAIILAMTIVLEIAARMNWRVRYGSRNFRIDTLYFIFYYCGVYHLLFYTWIYRVMAGFVSAYAPWLQMNLMASMSPAMQFVTLLLVSDFVGYWSHRARHTNRFLWAFHTIHHSETKLTVMSNYRFHFMDETLLRLWMFIPFQILGTSTAVWFTGDFVMAWILLMQHSEWNWTYGKAGWIFVSPVFHRLHHSTEERLQNRNFGMLFSVWDDLFGTAERKTPPPTRHGLLGDPVPESWLGQLVYPFLHLAREFRRPGPGAAASAPPVASTPAE